jgi:hypothetical protein
MGGPRDGTYRGYRVRKNLWLQLQGKQHVRLNSRVTDFTAATLREGVARRALRATSFLFLLRQRNFGLALRPARCKLVKDRGWVIR